MIKNSSISLLTTYFIALSFFAYSQTGGVSINNTNTPAHPSAILDVSSTSAPYLGMLIPRMTTANRNAIVSPAMGLLVYNTDCGLTEYYSGSCWISMSTNLKEPRPISCSGTTDFCANDSRTFTIPSINGATDYFWIAPAGATIISGQGSTSITVLFGNNSGEVCVTAENICETSPTRCTDIHINPVPLAPGNITGPTTAAPGTTASYFIAAVAGSSLYNWTVPAGATISSGVGTTSITVSFSCNAVSGNVSVTAQNNCGASTASSLAITLTPPVSASAGPDIASPGTLGGSPTASAGTSPYTYTWIPSTNLSSTTVANPTTTVCSATYTVTVTDDNGCTSSSSATATANPVPATPGTITGNTTVCANSTGNIYSIGSVTNATTYTWSVPSGASITSGQGTTSITVTFGNSSGDISVTADNYCGASSASTYAVTVNICTQTFSATSSGRMGTMQSYTVPTGVTSLTIETWGAQGGSGLSYSGGLGAYIKGTFTVTPGQVLKILVGQMGESNSSYKAGGGGGGTFVTDNSNNPLIVAGGGGGGGGNSSEGNGGPGLTTTSGGNSSCCSGGTSGSGGSQSGGSGAGGGLTGSASGSVCSGTTGGDSFISGGYGGTKGPCPASSSGGDGGFGGGGGGEWCCQGAPGAGGGYSGGAGLTSSGPGGPGGGSYNGGTSQTNTSGVRSGNGQVIINY